MDPSLTSLLVHVRQSVYVGAQKSFFINPTNYCCTLNENSGWPVNDPRVNISKTLTWRRTKRAPAEVISRELLHLRKTDPSLYSILLADYHLHHAPLIGAGLVPETIEQLDGNYEKAVRQGHQCRFNRLCHNPFHRNVVFSAERVTPNNLQRCTESFILHPTTVDHPEAYKCIKVPKYAWEEARQQFKSVAVKNNKKRSSEEALDDWLSGQGSVDSVLDDICM